jgi:Asp-tRNA(Asn)/Glu-tRNA(Gln) amidotransferase A subunit family amidase
MASRAVASLDTLGWMARSANDLELLRAALDQEDFAPCPPWPPAPAVQPHPPGVDAGRRGAAAWAEGLQRLGQAGIRWKTPRRRRC